MLRVQGLQKAFEGFMAVKQGNLTLEPGQIVAVIGPNGAGKTTLFNLIAGQLKPDAGRVVFKEENITGLPAYRICAKGIARSFQIVNLFGRLTVFENVQTALLSQQRRTFNVFTPSRRLAVKETEEILDSVGLMEKAHRKSGLLSYGDQKVLEMAVALGNRPELLILDEPTAGLSPEETGRIIDLIRRLTREMGLNILFCEHDMALVFALADSIMVMHQGVSIVQGAPDDVRNNELVREAYLGGEE